MGLSVLQFVVILVPVQSRHGTLDGLATSLHRGPMKGRCGLEASTVITAGHSDLSVLPQCLSDHDIGHAKTTATHKGEVGHVETGWLSLLRRSDWTWEGRGVVCCGSGVAKVARVKLVVQRSRVRSKVQGKEAVRLGCFPNTIRAGAGQSPPLS